jgi:hypothetical protein
MLNSLGKTWKKTNYDLQNEKIMEDCGHECDSLTSNFSLLNKKGQFVDCDVTTTFVLYIVSNNDIASLKIIIVIFQSCLLPPHRITFTQMTL